MNNISIENEKEISVNLMRKANCLLLFDGAFFIGFILIIILMFKLFSNLWLFVTIFSSILIGFILLSIFFASLTNFISYNYRDNLKKLYKNNKARSLFLILGYSFLWGVIILTFVFLMVLLILK